MGIIQVLFLVEAKNRDASDRVLDLLSLFFLRDPDIRKTVEMTLSEHESP